MYVPKQYNRKSGAYLHLTAAQTPGSREYLKQLNLQIPEKVRQRTGQEGTMQSIRKYRGANPSLSPKKIGEIELDTGIVEIGYADRQTYITFVQERQTEQQRVITQSTATHQQMICSGIGHDDEKHVSNQAMGLQYKEDGTMTQYMQQIQKMQQGRENTIKRVIPFLIMSEEQQQIDNLRMLQHHSNQRTDIHNAVSGLEIVKITKKQRQKAFIQALYEALGNVKQERNADKAYWIYVRRKKKIFDDFAQGVESEGELFGKSQQQENEQAYREGRS